MYEVYSIYFPTLDKPGSDYDSFYKLDTRSFQGVVCKIKVIELNNRSLIQIHFLGGTVKQFSGLPYIATCLDEKTS